MGNEVEIQNHHLKDICNKDHWEWILMSESRDNINTTSRILMTYILNVTLEVIVSTETVQQ